MTLPLSVFLLVTPFAGELLVTADAGPGEGVAFLPWLAGRFLFAAGLLAELFAAFDDLFPPPGLLSELIAFLPELLAMDLELSEL